MHAQLIRDARRVSAASAGCTLATSAAAIVLGIADRSIALVAFGAAGLFDFAADVLLVAHFGARGRGHPSEHFERTAERVITAGLLVVGVVAIVMGVRHLSSRDAAHVSVASVGLASVSLVVLALLAARKLFLGTRIASAVLRADGRLSAVGAALAGVTLLGLGATRALEWWWADPVAALVIGLGAVGLAVVFALSSGAVAAGE